MDIALKLKRAVATVAAGALFASSAGIALAQTFLDVTPDAWYYDYVEQLVDDGVIDVADFYRPADALNRAELVKIAIVAIDGLAGYEAPATPTFDDVAADAWYFDYVEAAVQLGIVNGYTDANGNLTGYYGPGDTVNRAAATKILVNAFAVPTDLDPGSVFPDVQAGEWFHDFVVTAYNQSVLDGYDNGFFGPADPVTRAQVAKLVVNAQNPVERTAGEGEGEGEGEVPASEGALEVSLNDNTPASSTLPLGANGVALASFDFTADQDDVAVTNLVVTRGGVGQAEDWENLYLYNGPNRLTTGRTLNNDTNTATFPLKDTVVAAGTTTTITLVGDVNNPAGASNQHYFYVASAADVTSNAQSVAGDFPVAGNTFTMGGATTIVNDVTVEKGTAPSKVTIGEQDAEVASIRIEAGAENDVALHQLALTNGGSLDSGKMVNLRLLRGTDEVATAEGFIGDVVTFVLDTPYIIDEGQTKTFYVRSDIDGGRSTDNIILYLDEDTDLIAIDQQFGFGASVNNNFTQSLANTVLLEGGDVTVTDNGPAATQIAQDATNIELLNYSLTAARDLTVRDTFLQIDIQHPDGVSGPTLPATGATNTEAAGAAPTPANDDTSSFCLVSAAGINVGDMLRVQAASGTVNLMVDTLTIGGTGFNFCDTNGIHVTTILAVGDAITPGAAVTELDPYDFVKNVKIVDLDSGNTMVGPLTDANSGSTLVAGPPSSFNRLHSEDYSLIGGETRHLSVQVDLDGDMPSGYQVRAQVQYPAGTIKDDDANEFVDVSNIIGAGATPLAGDLMITAENNLAVARASTPTSNDYVKGDNEVPTLGISMTAGDAGDINVRRINVRLYADDGTTAPTVDDPFDDADTAPAVATGNLAANTLVASVSLYDGNDLISGPESIDLVNVGGGVGFDPNTDYFQAQFDDINELIQAGQTKTLTVKVNLLNTASNTNYLALDINPATDIIAEDFDANTIAPTGAQFNLTSAKNPLITIIPSGSLTASSEDNPDEDILVTGATGQQVANYRFHAVDEDFLVKQLTIVNDGLLDGIADDFGQDGEAALSSAIKQVVIKYTDVNGVEKTSSASLSGTGTAKFAGLDFYVPAGGDAFLKVFADVNTTALAGQQISGKKIRLGLQNVNNDITTFQAIGQSSSTNLNFNKCAGVVCGVDVPADAVSNSGAIDNFVVRKSVPTFAKATTTESMSAGENTLMSFSVTADSAGAISFGRIVFDVTVNGGGITVDQFKFFRGTTTPNSLVTDANIYDGTGTDVDYLSGGSVGPGANQIIVSFDNEETVAAGSSKVYGLKGTVSGSVADDSIQTKISVDDENDEVGFGTGETPIIGDGISGCANDPVIASTGNGNTGRISDTSAANCALFSTGANTDFVDTLGTNRNIIWSDKSADNHLYPTVTGGVGTNPSVLTDGTGSFDWTNGYLLDITGLQPHSIKQ